MLRRASAASAAATGTAATATAAASAPAPVRAAAVAGSPAAWGFVDRHATRRLLVHESAV